MKILTLLFLLLFHTINYSQTYLPGNTYYGLDSLTEYKCGNLPIILSSPHGGYETPSTLPDRNCMGCVNSRDSYTQELTRQIEASIFSKTGCYPHVIINRLHRKKLDANREIIEATDSNVITEPYWHDYMNFIDSAKNRVIKKQKKGLFLDIHGHGHSIQRVELGYLLSGYKLRKSDSVLNTSTYKNYVSTKNLISNNLNSYSNSEIIRGKNSFGSILFRKGIPSVPSDSIPHPLSSESFFAGGYNTARFGSRDSGAIDAIQIESHQGVRLDSSVRLKYADSLAETILEYLEKHYFLDFSKTYCSTVSLEEINAQVSITLYPNPTSGYIYLNGISMDSKLDLYSIDGKWINSYYNMNKIDLNFLKKGVYIIRFTSLKIVKNIKFIKK